MFGGQFILWSGLILAADPVLAPPVPVGPRVAVAAAPQGYTITLARGPAELLRDTVDGADEKAIARSLRDEAARKKEGADKATADNAAQLELVAFLVASQLPAFKKALHENMGPHGVVIRVSGLQAPQVKFRKPRPKLERAAQLLRETMPLLPEEVRDAVEAMRAVARTTPLLWKVEPR